MTTNHIVKITPEKSQFIRELALDVAGPLLCDLEYGMRRIAESTGQMETVAGLGVGRGALIAGVEMIGRCLALSDDQIVKLIESVDTFAVEQANAAGNLANTERN